MSERLLRMSERWFALLLRLYPADFRDEMGESLLEAYRDRTRAVLRHGGRVRIVGVWFSALLDAVRNGPGERARPAVRWRRSGNWGRDSQLAMRRLQRSPIFALSIVATLTVGLGAFAIVYTAVNRILLAPMPYEKPDDLYFVWRNYTWVPFERGWLGGTDIDALQKAGGVIEEVAGLQNGNVVLTADGLGEATEIALMVTSPNLFDLLGVKPVIGRTFAAHEAGPDRAPLAVLTYAMWQRLGGSESILGQQLRMFGEPYTVIGVLPRDFGFVRNASIGPPQRADVYITFDEHLSETDPNGGAYAGLVRARPGTSPAVVESAIASVAKTIDEQHFRSRGLELYPTALHADLVSEVRPALVALGYAGVFLLLVLLANLSTLLLARAAQREHEYAVSRALGADRVALVRATVLEGGLLGVLGGAGAVLVAFWAIRTLVALTPIDLPRREFIAVDAGIALTIVAVGGLLGIIAGAAPAIWAARTRLSTLLHNAAVRGGGARARMRRGMVVVQVALSLVLLSTGGLVVRSFQQLLRAQPGFEPDGVLTLRIPITSQSTPEFSDALALQQGIVDALSAVPGVTSVGAASGLPLTAAPDQTGVRFPGAPGNTGDPEHDTPLIDYLMARHGYIETLGIRILAGEPFPRTYNDDAPHVLIDRQLAQTFFPTGNPIGAAMVVDDDTLRVAGVVEHARMYDVHQDGRPHLYLLNGGATGGYRSLAYVLRSERTPASLIPDVRAAIRGVDPQLAISDIRPMSDIVDDSIREQRITAVLIGGFSVGALLLAAMGLFGIVSGAVARRRHELAVRLALGADHGRLLRLIIGEGALLVLIGVTLAVPGIYFAGRAVRGVLVGVTPGDPLSLVAVTFGLGGIALAACYVPARRVLGIEPARSLRGE